MGYTVDVDIGGTFTDFFGAKDDGAMTLAKSPTTHYDLSVGFLRGLRDLAKGFGISLQNFLSECEAIRYCTDPRHQCPHRADRAEARPHHHLRLRGCRGHRTGPIVGGRYLGQRE